MIGLKAALRALGLALALAAGPTTLLARAPQDAQPLLAAGFGGPRAFATFLDCLESLERWSGNTLPNWIVHSSPLRYSARKPLYGADGKPLLGPDGKQACSQVTLTGRVFFPPTWRVPFQRDLPLVLYTHATMLKKDAVASKFGGSEWLLGATAALYYGLAVAMPDQPGMGDAQGAYHPFCHAKSLAYSTVDAIPPIRALVSEDPYLVRGGYAWDGRLFIMGYSEGAYTALASVKELEENAAEYAAKDGYQLTGSACMAGPFDLSGIARLDIINPVKPFSHCFYLPYVIRGYHSVYGALLDPEQAFAPVLLESREDGNILQWTDGSKDGPVVDELIGKRLGRRADQVVLRDLLNPAWVARELDDPAYEASNVHRLLMENDLHRGWTPTKPILFCHSPADQDIPFHDTTSTMANLGAAVVQAGRDPKQLLVLKTMGINGGPVSHIAGALFAIPTAFEWIHLGMPIK